MEKKRVSCEGFKAIKQMQPGKSPGTDGLPTVEFYRFFGNDISSLFVKSVNNAFRKGTLSVTQRRGIISLIPKEDKVLYHLKNWRTISLLNCDLKITAKVIADRIKSFFPSVINEDQTGFLKGRFIGENIRLTDYIIYFCEKKKYSWDALVCEF